MSINVKWIGGKDPIAQVQASQPMQQTPDFIACMMRLIGRPVDMPLELTLDFSRANYGIARAAFPRCGSARERRAVR